jgi:hypothetical protein
MWCIKIDRDLSRAKCFSDSERRELESVKNSEN